MTMTLRRTQTARKSLQRRIRQRVMPVLAVFTILAAIVAFAIPQVRERERLALQRLDAIQILSRDINGTLSAAAEALQGLTSSSFVGEYDELIGTHPDPVAPPTRLRLVQRDMLRSFADLISRRQDLILGVRYLTASNEVWGEALNLGGQVTLTSQYRLRSENEADPTYLKLIEAASNQPELGPINVQAGSVTMYLTVPDGSGGVIQLELNLAVFGSTLAEASQTQSSLFAPERALLLVDARGEAIAVSDTAVDFSTTRTLLSEVGGGFSDIAVGNELFSAATISPYRGTDVPWRLALRDNSASLLASANNTSILVALLVVGVGISTMFIIDRLILTALRPFETAVHSAAERLQTAEVSRVSTAQLKAIAPETLQQEVPHGDDQISALMGAIDTATARISQLSLDLDETVKRHNREIDIASRIGRETAGLIDIDELVNRAIQFISREMDFYHTQVFLLDDVGQNAVLAYSQGEAGRKMLEEEHKIRVGSATVIGRTVAGKLPIIVSDTRDPQSKHGFNALLPLTRSEMGLPLIVGNKVIGALDIQSSTPNAFEEDDLPVYTLLADQLAIAINKAQLVQQTQQRVEQINTLNRQLTREAWESFDDPLSEEYHLNYDLMKVQTDEDASNGQIGISVPISIRGEVIGELSAEPDADEALTAAHHTVLKAVADRVALAVENARLFTESQNNLSETRTLYTLSRNLSESQALAGVVDAVHATAMADAHRSQIWIFDAPAGEVKPNIAVIRADRYSPSARTTSKRPTPMDGTEIRMSELPFMQDLAYGSIVTIEDVEHDERLDDSTRQLFRQMACGSALILPLFVREEWFGVALFGFPLPRIFNARDMRLFPALIDPVSIACDNLLLLERNEITSARNESLYAASRIINTARDFSDLISAALATTTDTKVNFSLALLEGEPDETGWPSTQRVVAYSENLAVQQVNFRHRIRVSADSPMRNREPESILDATGSSPTLSQRVPWLPDPQSVRFIAQYPLFSGTSPIALLYVTSIEPRQLSSEDNVVYRAITSQMSTQLENRRLLESTEQALEETRRLYIATRAISSAQSLEDIFGATVDHLARPLVAATREASQDLRIMIWMAYPEPRQTANFLQLAHEWANDGLPSRIVDSGEKRIFRRDELPIAELVMGAVGPIMLNVTDAIDEEDPAAAVANTLHANGAAVALIVPVESHGYWFGALVAQSNRAEGLTDRYSSFMQTTAGQLGLALENRLLFDNARTEAQRAFALAEAAQLANQVGVDFEQSIDQVIRRVAEAANFDRWHLAIFEPRENSLNTITVQLPGYEQMAMGRMRPTDAHPLTSAMRLEQPLTINDPRALPEIYRGVYGKCIAAPIRLGATALGALLVGRSGDLADMDEADQRLVATLATQIAVALENRRLFLQAQAEQKTLSSTLATLPAGVIVLDQHTLEPIITNELARELLGDRATLPFSVENYRLFRSGTDEAYPQDGLCVYTTQATNEPASNDDIGIMTDKGEVDLLLSAAPVANVAGSTSAIVMTFSDISNLRALERSLQDVLNETVTIYGAQSRLSQADQLDDALDVLIFELQNLGMDEAYIVLRDLATGRLREARGIRTPLESAEALKHVLDSHDVRYIERVSASTVGEQAETELERLGLQSLMTVPLSSSISDAPVGWLVLGSRRSAAFSTDLQRVVTQIGEVSSTALDNRLLFQQTEAALQESAALYQASRALSNATSASDILDALVTTILSEHYSHAFVAQLNGARWDGAGALVTITAEWMRDGDNVLLNSIFSADEFPVWAALRVPEVISVADTEDPETNTVLRRYNVDPAIGLTINARAFAVIPLRVAARQIGAIWIGIDVPHNFNETEKRIFQSFGEQASLSLDSALLLEQTNRRAQQLETSAQVSNAAGQILDLDSLLPQIVDLVRDSFGYDHAQIFLLDANNEYAELRASTGEAGKQLLNIRHKLRKGSTSVIGRVTETGRPVIAQDTSEQGVVHAPNPYLPDTRSEMALPLILKGKVIGALDVQSKKANAFVREDIAALTTLAAQISVAIDNANLYQAAQDQADRMGLLFEVTTAAAAATSLREALQRVADNLYSSLAARAVAVYLKKEYQDHLGNTFSALEVDAVSGFGIENDDVLRVKLTERGGGALVQAARRQTLMVIHDLQLDTAYKPMAPEARSAVLVPLAGGGELLGMIVLEGQRPNEFDNETIQLLQTLSGSLTAVVQNGQLLERLTAANDELRELDRLKSDFLANMSHELRTPLNSIIGFSRMMLKGMSGPLNDMQEADLSTIFGSGQHLLTVINDILDQAKITAGKMTISVEEFDLKPEIEAVRSIGIGLVKDKPIDLRVEISNNLPMVYGDKVRVRQVLLNLVSNASKFTRQGSVTIRVYALEENKKKMVHVDVTDTGIGIAQQDMDLLFEPFRQVDSSLTRTAGGTGLGLPIARSLMELMGGELTVQTQVNVGSTFSITIPTEAPSQQPEEEAPAAPSEIVAAPPPMARPLPVTGPLVMPSMPVELKRQIVAIEDNPDMVDQFRRSLQREGWEIIVCGSALEARAVVPAMQPTLILMDVDFDNGTGWELLDEFVNREDTSDIPVIVATLSEDRDRAMDKGAFAFLQRPYSPDVLLEAVTRAEKIANVPRILLIDDQDEALRLLGQLLREHGNFKVYTARSGIEGLQQVAFRHPNLIVLDLRMPEMDGFAVLKELRENPETMNIPVMVVTSDTTLKEDERAQLKQVRVLPKVEISQTEYAAFLKGVSEKLGRQN